MNNDYCLVFVDGPLLPFLFLASQKNFEVAASLSTYLKVGWCLLLIIIGTLRYNDADVTKANRK